VPPKTSIRNIDTEIIFTGIDLNGFSNSKLIMDIETEELLEMKAEQIQKQKYEELIINKNDGIKENELSSVIEQSSNITTIDAQSSMNQIVSTHNSVVSITPSNKEVRKKVVDVVLRNLKNALEDNNNNNNNNNNNTSNELVLNLIRKIKQFGKDKQLDKMDKNSKRLISTNFANLIDLTESNITESPNKKSKHK
jgi:predicted HAD superfamily phosphohydrolase